MTREQELHYLKGQLKILEALKSKRFTPCRQSVALKHYIESQTISVESDIQTIENELYEN